MRHITRQSTICCPNTNIRPTYIPLVQIDVSDKRQNRSLGHFAQMCRENNMRNETVDKVDSGALSLRRQFEQTWINYREHLYSVHGIWYTASVHVLCRLSRKSTTRIAPLRHHVPTPPRTSLTPTTPPPHLHPTFVAAVAANPSPKNPTSAASARAASSDPSVTPIQTPNI